MGTRKSQRRNGTRANAKPSELKVITDNKVLRFPWLKPRKINETLKEQTASLENQLAGQTNQW
jgi:hypothetical protein